MNVKLAILGLVALVSFVEAQQPGSVRGTVTSITGEPLRKAEVRLQGMTTGSEPRAVATDSDSNGNFVFGGVMPGSYILSAERLGYLSPDDMRRTSALAALRAIRIAPGQEVSGVTIKLVPHSVISGKVLDEDGDPMFRASVSVLEEAFQRGRLVLNSRATVSVNDLGEYRIAGLQPGRYYISIDPKPEMGLPPLRVRAPGQESDLSFVPVYFPGVIDPAQATPIRLDKGQEARGIDIRLRRSPVVNVRGRVVDANGGSVSNVSVALLNNQGVASAAIGRSMAMPKPDGSFVLPRVPSGSYLVMASSMTAEGRTTAIANVDVGSRDVDDVLVRLMPSRQVMGIVRGEDNPDLRSVRVTLDPIDAFPPDMRSSDPLREGNTFSIPGVTQGRYRVALIGAPEGYYAKTVQWNGENIADKGLSVTSVITGIEITLAKGATTIHGSLIDSAGNKAPGGAVVAVPPQGKRDHWNLYAVTIVDQNGSFILRNLPPGEYTLFGYPAGGDASVFQNPEYLKQIESKGKIVKITAGTQETLTLQVVE